VALTDYASVALEWFERFVVCAPDRGAFRVDRLRRFELRKEKRRRQFARQVRRSGIDPCVFIDLSAKKTAAIRSFFANDLGALDETRIIDQQRASFAGGHVFRLVE